MYHLKVCSVRIFVVVGKKRFVELKKFRRELVDKIYTLVDKYGNSLMKNFEKKRLYKISRRESVTKVDTDQIIDEMKFAEKSPTSAMRLKKKSMHKDSQDSISDSNRNISGSKKKWEIERNEYEINKKIM